MEHLSLADSFCALICIRSLIKDNKGYKQIIRRKMFLIGQKSCVLLLVHVLFRPTVNTFFFFWRGWFREPNMKFQWCCDVSDQPDTFMSHEGLKSRFTADCRVHYEGLWWRECSLVKCLPLCELHTVVIHVERKIHQRVNNFRRRCTTILQLRGRTMFKYFHAML